MPWPFDTTRVVEAAPALEFVLPPGASDLPGLEVAGEIVSGDAAALAEAGFAIGDRVCALIAGGGYAQLCVAPVAQCLPVPKGWSDVEAASLPETFFTVWSNVFERGRLQKGETLLIQGGSSGIGVTAIQIAKALGATVIVTAGSDDKCEACLKLGADHAINYRTADFLLTTFKACDILNFNNLIVFSISHTSSIASFIFILKNANLF